MRVRRLFNLQGPLPTLPRSTEGGKMRAKMAGLLVVGLVGCQPYGSTRPEIFGNGQGGIEVKHVANDAPPPPAVHADSSAPPANATVDDLRSRIRQQQYEIESLQSALRARDEEIRRLKQ